METSTASEPVPGELWVLAPIPPPVTGLTVLTREILDALRKAGPVRFLNWSPAMARLGIRSRLKRNWRICRSLGSLLRRGRVRDQRMYTVANSDSGLYATGLVVLLGCKLGYTVFLHHHVYTYIDRYDWRVAWIDRLLGNRGVHVVHSEKMAEDFCRKYPTQARFAIVHPSIVPIEIGDARRSVQQPCRLGFLSHLTLAKGLDLVIETFERLRQAGRDVTLTLAGAIPSVASQRLIRQVAERYPGRIEHLGPVFGADKARFYASVDIFVFPTRSESWGLVLHEAIGAGVPVITIDRGCTSIVVGNGAGLLVSPDSSFVDEAVAQVDMWMRDHVRYAHASEAALVQAERLSAESQHTLQEFVQQIFSADSRHSSPIRTSAVNRAGCYFKDKPHA